jgi:hypothetical protein
MGRSLGGAQLSQARIDVVTEHWGEREGAVVIGDPPPLSGLVARRVHPAAHAIVGCEVVAELQVVKRLPPNPQHRLT